MKAATSLNPETSGNPRTHSADPITNVMPLQPFMLKDYPACSGPPLFSGCSIGVGTDTSVDKFLKIGHVDELG
jgi:hypothetical protein